MRVIDLWTVPGIFFVEEYSERRSRKEKQIHEIKLCMKKREVFCLCGKSIVHVCV
jgi:hypothetical protein